MKTKWICAALVASVLPLTVGCSTSPVVRGQSPASNYEVVGNHVYESQVIGSCPDCQWGPAAHRSGPALKPEHWLSMQYQVPKHLSYPQDNMPAPVVQYPYYTHKGPSDFFME